MLSLLPHFLPPFFPSFYRSRSHLENNLGLLSDLSWVQVVSVDVAVAQDSPGSEQFLDGVLDELGLVFGHFLRRLFAAAAAAVHGLLRGGGSGGGSGEGLCQFLGAMERVLSDCAKISLEQRVG